MPRLTILTDGGYKGLEAAVGKTVYATKFLGHWNVQADELEALGCTPCMAEYAFLPREVKVEWHTQGL